MHMSTGSTRAWESPGNVSNQPRSPPFATTSIGAAAPKANNTSPSSTAAPTQPTTFGNSLTKPQATPSAVGFNSGGGTASPTVPGPIPSESPNKLGSRQQPVVSKPMVPAAAPAVASGKANRKRRATEDPEGAPNPHNPPKPPLFSSMLSSPHNQPASTAPAPAFSFMPDGAKGAPAGNTADKSSSKANDSTSGGAPIPKPPLFGSLFSASSAAASGGGSAAPAGSSAAPATDTSKPFAALFGNSSTGLFLMLLFLLFHYGPLTIMLHCMDRVYIMHHELKW